MKNLTLLIFITLISATNVMADECVILLHGLVRASSSMNKLEVALTKSGYQVVNYDYPSTKYKIEDLADDAIPKAISNCTESSKINFVTHSMGGILVRQYLSKNKIVNLNRVVMLGPPNQGSQVVDKLKNVPGYEWLNGPAGMQLGTDENSVPKNLGRVDFELGVIAGTQSMNLILSTMLPSPNDGKVSVENTKIEGMTDHIALPVTHPFMMKNDNVIKQVLYFLKHGQFDHEIKNSVMI